MRNAFLGLTLLLTGCAGFSPGMGLKLEESAAVPSLNAIRPVALTLNQLTTHEIDATAPVFQFSTGKSFTGVFQLPTYQPGTVLEIKSYCHCLGLSKGVFIPIADVLDANYKKIDEIKFTTHTQTWRQPVHYIGGITLSAEKKYIVLYTDPKRFGKAADTVYVEVVDQTTERMDYIRKGYTQTTYTERQASVWWEGDAIGELTLVVKNNQFVDKSE